MTSTILALLLAAAMSATLAGGSSAGPTLNVLGGALRACGAGVGYFHDGFCRTIESDRGVHVVAAVVDERFLTFTASRGNDLSTPRGASFPGLREGDRWCLCALRPRWLCAVRVYVCGAAARRHRCRRKRRRAAR